MEYMLRMFSLFFVLSGIVCALIILFYIFPKRRQSMKIMEAVWPLTGLWANWPGLWAYVKMGIEKHGNLSPTHPPMQVKGEKGMEMKMEMPARPAWQIGMYGWMAICMFGMKLYLPYNSWQFWFMMQIAMYFGFLVSYPANWILIRMGIKHGM